MSPAQPIAHRSVKLETPIYSQLASSAVDKLPLKVQYNYCKTGNNIPVCAPTINYFHYDDVLFNTECFELEHLSESEIIELLNIRDELREWMPFLKNNEFPFIDSHRLYQFSKECAEHIEASKSLKTEDKDSWCRAKIFVTFINDPKCQLGKNKKIVSSIAYCKTHLRGDIYIYQIFSNPHFQIHEGCTHIIHGSGRALIQGVINHMENSEQYKSVSIMPYNKTSAYIAHTLGF